MPEKALRFGITDGEGHCASTWKLWTPNNKSDVYLACRKLGGSLKASLHESGQWHIAYSKAAFEKYVQGAITTQQDRFMEKWPRPLPIAPGITLAFRIVTPHSSVTSNIKDEEKNIIWIPNSPSLYAIEIAILITSPEASFPDWPGKKNMKTKLIGSYEMISGDSVWAVYRVISMQNSTSTMKGYGKFYKGKSPEDLKSTSLRMLAFGNESDRSRTIYDLAVMRKDKQHEEKGSLDKIMRSEEKN